MRSINSVGQFIDYLESEYNEKIAFQWFDYEKKELYSKTFAEFVADVWQFAGFLQRQDSDADGKHYAIIANNSYDYVVCIFAVMCYGGVIVPLNSRISGDALADEIALADVDVIFADVSGKVMIEKTSISSRVKVIGLSEYHRYQGAIDKRELHEPERLIALMHTSGTVGKNKCVMLTEGNFCGLLKHNVNILLNANEVEPLESFFMCLPLYHIMSFSELIILMYVGIRVDFSSDIKKFDRELNILNSNITCVVPVIINKWHKDIQKGIIKKIGNLRIIASGGAILSPSCVETFEKIGIKIVTLYGLSETFGAGTHNVMCLSKKYDSVGRLSSSNMKIKFEEGEICLQGDMVMKGYYRNPEDTGIVLKNGWLHTGDMGYLDNQNYLHISGRKKSIIILSNGKNINPEELEEELEKCPYVIEVLVKEKDDKICAEIFCDSKNIEEIKRYIRNFNVSLPFYKRISKMEFVENSFLKTESGKIKR